MNRTLLLLALLLAPAARGDEATEKLRKKGDEAFAAHRYAAAEKQYRELLRQSDAGWGTSWNVLFRHGLRELIEVWRAENRLAEHEDEWRRELAQSEARHGHESLELIRPLEALGLAANARGDYRGALTFFDRIAAILDHAHPKRHASVEVRAVSELDDGPLYQQFLVFLHLAASDIPGARKQMAFRDVATRTLGNSTVDSGSNSALDDLYDETVVAWVPLLDGHATLAAAKLGAAAKKAERLLGDDHFNTATVFDAWAGALEQSGKADAAARARAHADAGRRRATARQKKSRTE
jgi:hypothetical protein